MPAKIDNSLDLDYPAERFEIAVISDASTDGTDGIVAGRGGGVIGLMRFSERVGKVEGINRAVPGLRAGIVVLSDANTMYRRDAVRKLVRHFADPEVGLVSGELRLVNPRLESAGAHESWYWRYECWVRRSESRLGRLTGATGPVYAFRRELFRPVDSGMFCDLVVPVRIAMQGFRTVYDPEAVGQEEAADDIGTDLRRRFRNGARGIRSAVRLLGEATIRGRLDLVFQLVSHKLLRWLTFPLMVGVLAGTGLGEAPGFRMAFLLQVVFYAVALTGGILDRFGVRRSPWLAPYHFVVAQAAVFAGLMSGLTRRGKPYWSPRRA